MARLNRYAGDDPGPMSSSFRLQKLAITALLLTLCFSLRSNAQQAPIAPPPTPRESQPPASQDQDKDKNNAPSDHKEAGAAVDSNTYKIGPSDVLSIRVWNEEKFSG